MVINVSRIMSTQHPDNVRPPFFSDNAVLEGEEEAKEAFYAFSHINCREQLWDCEGKEVDSHVVKKLLTRYEPFFRKHKLGQDVFITLRVPNPEVERNEAKILLETLESIPRSFDVSKAFYGDDVAPIFEISVPMVTSSRTILRIAEYYKKIVVGKKDVSLLDGDVEISKWIGDFGPQKINIIPLFEDKAGILDSAKIVSEYMAAQKVEEYQRVWIARSDPALNYGSLSAVILGKIAMQRLHKLAEESSVEILPILGCGSTPFRGNFKPTNIDNGLTGFPSVHTFTIQSAFKYDYPTNVVVDAIEEANSKKRKEPIPVDEERLLAIFDRVSDEYCKQVQLLAPIVNEFARFVPARRKRKLHIGLFGYARAGSGVHLPRAITFCASLYSLGFPPEVLGLSSLTGQDVDYITTFYPHFREDLGDAFQYLNKDNFDFFPYEVVKGAEKAIQLVDFEVERKHQKVTSIIRDDFKNKNFAALQENIARAGWIRGFLG